MIRLVLSLASAGAVAMTGCAAGSGSGSGDGGTPPTSRYRLGGIVSGLAGSGLVLHSSLGEDLPVAADGAFVFASTAPSGTAYTVTVKQQPSSPSQSCTVANGQGTVGGADVVRVTVTCVDNTFAVGGTVKGLAPGTSVTLQDNGGDDLLVSAVTSADVTFTFRTRLAPGAPYAVTANAPAGQICAVASSSGTMGAADVTGVVVSCASTAATLQRWQAVPAPSATFWQDSPTMQQHATFDGTTIQDTKLPAGSWSVVGGALPAQTQVKAFAAGPRWSAGPFANGIHYEAIPSAATAQVDQLTGNMLVCAVVKPDYNPSVDGVSDGKQEIILAKGHHESAGGGWVLMQMDNMFCFHYQYVDRASGASTWTMTYTPTFFPDRNRPQNGPLNPTYVVVCAGRSGDTIVTTANAYPDAYALFPSTVPGPLDEGATPHKLTIGGYDDDASFQYGGRVYETAIWAEAATPANIQAKLNEALWLPAGARYTRNREGPYHFSDAPLDGAYHTAWRNALRVDPVLGALFGLQGWNRLSYYDPTLYNTGDNRISQRNPIVTKGEDLSGTDPSGAPLWSAVGTASAARDTGVHPPGDSGQAWADLVTLAPGASLSTALGRFDAAGPVHAMMWVRPVTGGTLRVRTTHPASGTTSQSDVALGTPAVPLGKWSRVWLAGLTNDGSSSPATVFLENPAGSAASFQLYAWGIDLTQLGGGGDLASFDPGVEMYDWGADDTLGIAGQASYPVDLLELPAVPASTAQTGFCLSVDAQPPAGMAWNAPLASDRGVLAWVSDQGGPMFKLYVQGTQSGGTSRKVCYTQGAATVCGDPSSWAAGSRHTVTGCSSANGGSVRLYLDGVQAGPTGAAGAAPPDLTSGHLVVGNAATASVPSATQPFHGYVAQALACIDTGGAATGCH